jgi:hypothetical protein
METSTLDPSQELDFDFSVPVKPEDSRSLLQILADAIGVDVTRITIPVSYNEPTTFLQRVMEAATHCYLLRLANQIAPYDKDLAMLYVGVFSLSTFGCSIQRTSKPFNPMLGETFEYTDEKRGIKFVSEQVSHHPPISACYVEDDNFEMTAYFKVATRFTGNAVEVEPASTTIIKLKSTGAQYTYGGIKSVLNNLLVGTMWIDMYGDITVKEVNSTRVFHLSCAQCGWFSAGWHEVSGDVIGEDGEIVFQIDGKWNETIYATRKRLAPGAQVVPRSGEAKDDWQLDENGEVVKPEHIPFDMKLEAIPSYSIGSKCPVWYNVEEKCENDPYSQWNMTTLSVDACGLSTARADLPKTDSRRRPDRIALENLDYSKAASEKHRLEEAQRHQKKVRDEKQLPWLPKFFEEDVNNVEHRWKYKNNYWSKK